jgi:CheY-like chemotaxis protein
MSNIDASAGHRVLVIDDDHDVADSLVMFLQTFGADVRVAYSGEDGLEAVREFRPRLVFLDIGMPRMDGYETARRLRALPEGNDVKLVALTGWGEEQISDRAREAGFDRQLTKPAGPETLQGLLDSLA